MTFFIAKVMATLIGITELAMHVDYIACDTYKFMSDSAAVYPGSLKCIYPLKI